MDTITKENTSPLNISLDTQFMINFLMGSEYIETNLDRCKRDILDKDSSQNSNDENWEMVINYNFQRNNYFYIKFLRHLIETGKVKINVPPTVFSEAFYSKNVNDRILEFFKDNQVLIKDYITADEINEIIENTNVSKSHKKIFKETYTTEISIDDKDNKLKYPYHIEYNNDILLNNKLRPPIINHLKYKIFKDELKENENNLNLIHIPKTDKNNNYNELLDSIVALAFNYRYDKKDVLNKKDLHPIPAKEINDSTIMSTCSHLGLPLISGDFKGLINHEGKIKLENEKLSNIQNKKIYSQPFSLEQFIADFYKDEFMEFIDKFNLPEELKDLFNIEDIIKTYNSENIRQLLKTENLSDFKDVKKLFKRIIESYNTRNLTEIYSKPSTKANINKFKYIQDKAFKNRNIDILTPKEIVEEANNEVYDESIHFVNSSRKLSNQKNINITKKILRNYKNNFIQIRSELQGLSKNFQNQTHSVFDIAYLSQMTFLDLIKPINYLLQIYDNTQANQINHDMLEHFNKLGITLYINECSNIQSFKYKGINFSLKKNHHLNNTKQLDIDFDINELEDEALIILATNPTILEYFENKDKQKCRQLLDGLNRYCKTHKYFKDKKCNYPPNIYDFQNIYKNKLLITSSNNSEFSRNLTSEELFKMTRMSNYILNFLYKDYLVSTPEQN